MTPAHFVSTVETHVHQTNNRIVVDHFFQLPNDRVSVEFTLKTDVRQFTLGKIFDLQTLRAAVDPAALMAQYGKEVAEEFFMAFSQEGRE